MKKLVMSALLIAAASQAAGCIFVSGDDDGGGGTASVSASWDVLNDGSPANCPAGATTAAVNAQRSTDTDPFVDLYDCSAGAGIADNLPAGDYEVWIDLTDDSGATLFAESESFNVSLGDGENVSANFQIDAYNGAFDVSWDILDSGGTDVGCAGAPNGVGILGTLSGTTEATDTRLDCAAGLDPTIATTDPMALGDYVVVLSILDNANPPLSQGDSAEIQSSLDFGNQFVDLGIVDIQFGHFN